MIGLLFNAILNTYSIVLLITVASYARKSLLGKKCHDRIFFGMISISVLMLLLDIISRFDGMDWTFFPFFNHLGNFLIFLLHPIFSALWMLYILSLSKPETRPSARIYLPLGIVISMNALLTIASLQTGWYYTIDAENIYHRGPLFFVPVLMTFGILIASIFIAISHHKQLGRTCFRSILVVNVPIITAILLQVFFYGFSLILNSAALSVLLIYLGIQRRSACMDYLTGVGNRKMLDESLQEKIKAASLQKTFAAVMIDLDGFKEINDTYGHVKGDEALEKTASIIRSCIHSDDLITRYGGDEFILLLNDATILRTKQVVDQLKIQASRFNHQNAASYALDFSIGAAVYDPRTHKSAASFLKDIDALMYEEKLSKRSDAS